MITLMMDMRIEREDIEMTNLDKYNKIFTSSLEVPESRLGSAFTFKDTPEWDSVAHLNLVTNLEDEFDIMLESDDILHFGSYENGKLILKKYGVEL